MEKINIFLFDEDNNHSISLNVSKQIAELCDKDPVYARSLLLMTKKQMGIHIPDEKFILTLEDGLHGTEYPITVGPDEYCKAFHDMCFATELLTEATKNASSSVSLDVEPVASTSASTESTSNVCSNASNFELDKKNSAVENILSQNEEAVLFRSNSKDEEEDSFVDKIVGENLTQCLSGTDSSEDEPVVVQNESKKRKTDGEWSDEEIRYLLTLYKNNKDTLQFNQRKLWRIISDALQKKGSLKTFNQCKTKIDNLKTKYKIITDHNNRTGNDHQTCKFYEELDEIFSSRAWVNPTYIAGPMSAMNVKENKSCKKSQVAEKFLELQKLKLEDNRRYRRDKLNILREISTNMFEKK